MQLSTNLNRAFGTALAAAALACGLAFVVPQSSYAATTTLKASSTKSITITKGAGAHATKLRIPGVKYKDRKKIHWSSSKSSIASPVKCKKNESNKKSWKKVWYRTAGIKCKKAGTTVITAKYKGKKYKCKVTVKNKKATVSYAKAPAYFAKKVYNQGTIARSGDHYIETSYSSNGSFYTYRISTSSPDGPLYFSMQYNNLELIFSIENSDSIEPICSIGRYNSTTALSRKTYTGKKSLNWQVIPNISTANSRKVAELSDAALQLGMLKWNELLYDYLSGIQDNVPLKCLFPSWTY